MRNERSPRNLPDASTLSRLQDELRLVEKEMSQA